MQKIPKNRIARIFHIFYIHSFHFFIISVHSITSHFTPGSHFTPKILKIPLNTQNTHKYLKYKKYKKCQKSQHFSLIPIISLHSITAHTLSLHPTLKIHHYSTKTTPPPTPPFPTTHLPAQRSNHYTTLPSPTHPTITPINYT